ncbi:hypothetical protein CHS0354_018135 [Potamilus streckersoni]|uniref:SOCS box domain-containing protein n=1 Tax=Potamilus streckersoni TaxID=2493646 RepID=A0AAE0STA9_9BIVA|nr:hypothetical protein CHS0354_018135 [Potamilus streckersoni]
MASSDEILHAAIRSGKFDEVQKLIDHGINLNRVYGMRGTALCAGIEARNIQMVNFLLKAGSDVNAQDWDGEPPLILALRKNCLDIARVLINHKKIAIDKVDPLTKKTALHFATENKMVDVVKWLITGGCDLNKADIESNIALHLAVSAKFHDIVDILVSQKNCLIKFYNRAGMVPLHVACKSDDVQSLKLILGVIRERVKRKSNNDDLGELLMNDNYLSVNVNSETIYEKDSCLHLAARNGNKEVLKLLISHGAKVNAKNNLGQTPLLLACSLQSVSNSLTLSNHDNFVPEILLKAGADPNVRAHMRNWKHGPKNVEVTPLVMSCIYNNVELCRSLIKYGANINLCDSTGQSPLFTALDNNARQIAWYFLSEVPEINVNHQNHLGMTCLHAILKCFNDKDVNEVYELTKAILKHGGVLSPDKKGETPLVAALDYENASVVQAILEETAINLQDYAINDHAGSTLLHVSARMGLIEISRILLAHGADIDALTTETRHTPLFEALHNDQTEMVEFLVQNGCDLNLDSSIWENGESENSEQEERSLDIDDELLNWVREESCHPKSLYLLTMISIRRHFHANNLCFKYIDVLPLPEKLKNNLKYR